MHFLELRSLAIRLWSASFAMPEPSFLGRPQWANGPNVDPAKLARLMVGVPTVVKFMELTIHIKTPVGAPAAVL